MIDDKIGKIMILERMCLDAKRGVKDGTFDLETYTELVNQLQVLILEHELEEMEVVCDVR